MGKGGALNSWLREFCALVFTQTIQAFIYAIIITLIMATSQFGVEAENNEYRQDQLINTTSMGIINIFALTSIFKIEELARKVFGIQRSSIDAKNPMSSMAKLAFMAHFGRRLWDNGKKMIKGGAGILSYGRNRRKDKKKYYQQLERKIAAENKINKKINDLEEGNNSTDAAASAALDAAGGGAVGRGVGTGTLDVATLNINATNVNMNGSVGSGNLSKEEQLEKLRDKRDALREAIIDLNDSYDDKVKTNNKALVDSIHMAMSGAAETAGAILGGSLGAVIGGADGKDVSHGVVAGMGIGDRVGQTLVDTGFSARDLVVDIKKDVENRKKIKENSASYAELERTLKRYKDNIKEENKKLYESLAIQNAPRPSTDDAVDDSSR